MQIRAGALFFISLGFFIAGASIVAAHATGRSVNAQVGDYLIDIGVNPDPVVLGDNIYFDFKLFKKDPSLDATYSDVWVRVLRGKDTLFATALNRSALGQTGMVYTFDAPGTYTVSARYENGEAVLAETTFDVPVGRKQKEWGEYLPYVAAFLLGAVLCTGATFLLRGKRR